MTAFDVLTLALAIAIVFVVAGLTLWMVNIWEVRKERRIRAYVVRSGEVEVFEHPIPPPENAHNGDEYGIRCWSGAWRVHIWHGGKWQARS